MATNPAHCSSGYPCPDSAVRATPRRTRSTAQSEFYQLRGLEMAAMPPMTGVYNIPAEPDSPYVHHQTVRRLPSMKRFELERSGIVERLEQIIRGYLDDGGFPTHNEILE